MGSVTVYRNVFTVKNHEVVAMLTKKRLNMILCSPYCFQLSTILFSVVTPCSRNIYIVKYIGATTSLSPVILRAKNVFSAV